MVPGFGLGALVVDLHSSLILLIPSVFPGHFLFIGPVVLFILLYSCYTHNN
jgi:hypothetical protein